MGVGCATRKTEVASWQGAVNDAHHFQCRMASGHQPVKCHEQDIQCWIGQTPGARPRYFRNGQTNMAAPNTTGTPTNAGGFTLKQQAAFDEQGSLITQIGDVVKQLYADQTVTKNTVEDLKAHPAASDNTMLFVIIGIALFLFLKK